MKLPFVPNLPNYRRYKVHLGLFKGTKCTSYKWVETNETRVNMKASMAGLAKLVKIAF